MREPKQRYGGRVASDGMHPVLSLGATLGLLYAKGLRQMNRCKGIALQEQGVGGFSLVEEYENRSQTRFALKKLVCRQQGKRVMLGLLGFQGDNCALKRKEHARVETYREEGMVGDEV